MEHLLEAEVIAEHMVDFETARVVEPAAWEKNAPSKTVGCPYIYNLLGFLPHLVPARQLCVGSGG